jgi:hypothetical protein
MRAHPLVRRLLSPGGFVLVGLMFLLPFLTVSCSPPNTGAQDSGTFTATYTGADLVAGRLPMMTVVQGGPTGETISHGRTVAGAEYGVPNPPGAMEPFALAALVLTALGVLVVLLPRARVRSVASAALALVAALALLAAQLRTAHAVERWMSKTYLAVAGGAPDTNVPDVGQFLHIGLGLWLAYGLLLLIGFGNVAVSVPDKPPAPEPAAGPAPPPALVADSQP